jgi:hypothetical protein
MESSAQGTGASGEQATREFPSVGAPGTSSSAETQAASDSDVFAQRPELFVGAAFAGGLVLAQILKRVRR